MIGEELDLLKAQLINYKNLTVKLIELLENDEFDTLESVLELRKDIIEVIDNLHFKTSVFKAICEEISILPLQKKLTLLMNEKKASIKNEINNLKNTKMANNNYNKGYSIDSLYFSKKI